MNTYCEIELSYQTQISYEISPGDVIELNYKIYSSHQIELSNDILVNLIKPI